MNAPQLLAKLHEELIEANGEIDNFSSFRRRAARPGAADPRPRRRGHSAARGGAHGRGRSRRAPRAGTGRTGAGGVEAPGEPQSFSTT
jgi:hypothetical protein